MESYLTHGPYDLVSPDGKITHLKWKSDTVLQASLLIESISPVFRGFFLDPKLLFFNLKSTLAQIGIHSRDLAIQLDPKKLRAELQIDLIAHGKIAEEMLQLLPLSSYIGKLFAPDPARRVRDPDYLLRMFGRCDREGRPLLLLGGMEQGGDFILEKIEGRTVAYLALKPGVVTYEESVHGFLPTLAKALLHNTPNTRQLLQLHQHLSPQRQRRVHPHEILLVRTAPLHVRTVYGRVINELLPPGYHHTSASVLQPDTAASGDIYELFGVSHQPIQEIPLEFYTLEPHREHVFFSDRDQLQATLDEPEALFKAFDTAPAKTSAALFVVKGTQLQTLQPSDWIIRDPKKHPFPGLAHPSRQALLVEKYIDNQPATPFLKSIEEGLITSQGVLLTRYFPTPLLKRILLNEIVTRSLKRIYFEIPSASHDLFFSQEDRALLVDLANFAVPVYWVDRTSQQILQYVLKPEKDVGMFVPLALVEAFRKATVIGLYGSNLIEGDFAPEFTALLQGLLALRTHTNHPLLCTDTPLALVTGGGPGAMEVGNRVAKTCGLLSCANIVDFRPKEGGVVNEQKTNPYIQAKMTYRLDRLVERQAEFYLDLPIFLPGGIGTDFEYTLEEVRRKTGGCPANPVLLFGPAAHWSQKITSRFQENLKSGTIRGSEWVSNCFYCIETAEEGLQVLKKFFTNTLPIGKEGPVYPEGFCIVKNGLKPL
jgi:predicted Rossmann-fold nucleotide-binding protein